MQGELRMQIPRMRHFDEPSVGSRSAASGGLDTRVQRWSVLPFLVLLAVGAAVIAGLIVIAARGQDRISVNNSIELVRSVLAVQQRDLARTTRDYAWWDEAYANLAAKPDAGWANENIGSYVKDSFGVSG